MKNVILLCNVVAFGALVVFAVTTRSAGQITVDDVMREGRQVGERYLCEDEIAVRLEYRAAELEKIWFIEEFPEGTEGMAVMTRVRQEGAYREYFNGHDALYIDGTHLRFRINGIDVLEECEEV